MMFATVLHNLKSPENTGMILRAHVAFGGERFVIVGPAPWRFKKRTQAFSRRLERVTPIIHIPDDEAFFRWCQNESFTPVAVEISEDPVYLPRFAFPERPAVIVGHEGRGLPEEFLRRCCIALYELNRLRPVERVVSGHMFVVGDNERPEGFEQLLPPAVMSGRRGDDRR